MLRRPTARLEPWIAGSAAVLCGILAVGCTHKPVAKANAKVRAQASARIAATPRPPPPPPRAADGSYTVAGQRYLEFVTGGARPNDTLPMVVVFHGHGGDPTMFENHFKDFPSKARFIAPFGIHPGEHGGYEWFPGGASHHQNLNELSAVLPGVESQVAASLAVIQKTRPSVGKLIISGFSQGAVMTYSMALRHGDQISVACPVAGLIPKDILKSSKPPTVKPELHAVHGDADQAIKLSDAQWTVNALKKLGFKADLKVFRGMGHQFEPAIGDVMNCIDRGVRSATASATASATTPTSAARTR